jgi:hypothetical protein
MNYEMMSDLHKVRWFRLPESLYRKRDVESACKNRCYCEHAHDSFQHGDRTEMTVATERGQFGRYKIRHVAAEALYQAATLRHQHNLSQ